MINLTYSPLFSPSLLILDTSTAELIQLYRIQSIQTTRPIMLVVSKVTFELGVGGATVLVTLVLPSIILNMPGLHSFSAKKKKNQSKKLDKN